MNGLKLRIITCFLILFQLPVTAQNSGQSVQENRAYKRLVETQKQYNAAIAKGDSEEIAEACYLLGKRYIGFGAYFKAENWLFKSLSIREPLGPSEGIGKAYLRLAECQIYQKKSPEKTLQYARLAIQNFEKVHSRAGLMSAYRLLSGAHSEAILNVGREKSTLFRGSIDSVLYYMQKSLEIAEESKKPIDVGLAYQCMSDAYSLAGSISKSDWYRQKAIDVFKKEKLYNNVIDVATCYGQDLMKRGKLKQAKKWLDYSSELANSDKSSMIWSQRMTLEETFMSYYAKTGDWKTAFIFQKEVQRLKLAQVDNYRDDAIRNMNLMHENEKKSVQLAARGKEIALQNKNFATQNRLTGVTLILFGVAGVAGFFFFLLFKKYKKLSRENAELVMEQNHRIKNNLQSVSDLLSLQLLRLSDPEAIRAMEESLLRVEAMSLVHRRLYGGDKLVEVELRKYIPDLVKSVLRSYDLEFVTVQYELDNIWLHSEKAIPFGLIINELATNACKYALEKSPSPVLEISCFGTAGEINFAFSDNGPGFSPDPHSNSFGLKLIELMAKNLKGHMTFTGNKGGRFKLSFESSVTTQDHQKIEFSQSRIS